MKLISVLLVTTACCLSKTFAQEIIIHEQFNDNKKGWYVSKEAKDVFRIDSGYYHIESSAVLRHLAFTPAITGALYASCIARITGFSRASSYGFYLSSGREYESPSLFFVVSPAGYYSIFLRRSGATVPVKKWTVSPYIFSKDTFNTISVAGDSDSMSLYINDFHVADFAPPLYGFTAMGIALFDSSKADFDELFLLAYGDSMKRFTTDPYDLPSVLTLLLSDAAEGFSSVRGERSDSGFYDSRLWIPGAGEVFLDDKKYTALFGAYDTPQAAKSAIYILREKIIRAMPGAMVSDGLDDEGLPYYLIGKTVNETLVKPYVDLYLFTKVADGKKYYYVAIDIESSQ